jgi:long-chain acyl-CoA synthetase
LVCRHDDTANGSAYVGGVNLADLMIASRRRTTVALAGGGSELSYHALDKGSARLASLLRARGVRPGDHVGLMVPNVPEFAIVYYAILRVGGVVLSMDDGWPRSKITYCLRDAGARLLFAWSSAAEVAEEAAQEAGADCVFVTPGEFDRVLSHLAPDHDVCDRGEEDPAAIVYPAGKDPSPQASVVTHGAGISEAAASASACAMSDRDVTLGALPLHHHLGQTFVLNLTMLAGGRVALMAHFDADEAVALIARDEVTFVPASREMCSELTDRLDRSAPDGPWPRMCVLEEAVNGGGLAVSA